MKKIVSKSIEIIGYIILFTTWILYHLTKEKMGIQRDYIFRNNQLMIKYFDSSYQYVFIIIILFTITLIINKLIKNKSTRSLDSYITITLGVSWIIILVFKSNIPFVGLPMILTSVGMIYLGKALKHI